MLPADRDVQDLAGMLRVDRDVGGLTLPAGGRAELVLTLWLRGLCVAIALLQRPDVTEGLCRRTETFLKDI